MRDLVFHLADATMEEAFRAFFRHNNWHFAPGCGRFNMDAESQRDIFRIAGTNSGLNPNRNDPVTWKKAQFGCFKSEHKALAYVFSTTARHPPDFKTPQ